MMMTAINRTFSALLLLLPTLAAPVLAQERQPIDEIVAVVDDGVILRSELDAAIQNISVQFEARGDRLPPRSVLEEQVLDRLIINRIQIQRAEQTGIRVSDQEVDQALSRLAQQNRLSLPELRQAIERDGMSFDEFRDEIREELTTSALRQRIVDSMDEVTDTEIDIMLESDQFEGDEYNLSQIVVQVPESAGPGDIARAEEKVADVYQRLQDGLDFASAAVSYSEGPNALEGGDIGWRNLNTLPRQVSDALADLQPGAFTQPLPIQGGRVILKVNDRRARSEIIIDELQARHILVQSSELVTQEAARRLIEDLHGQIEDGADFAELAREFSDDQRTSNIGGLMSWFPRGAYGETFQGVLDSLDTGEVSRPFQSGSGWHLLKLEGQRETDRTVEAMRSQARDLIMEQKADEEIDRVLRQMRDDAYIDTRL